MPDLKKKSYDHTLLVTLFLIMIIGLVILYSTSAYNGEVKFHDSFYYLKKQLFATGLGVVAMFVMAGTDYHFWKKFAIPAYLGAILLSIAVVLFGDEYNGSKRWLSLGPFSFQPSEYAKVAVILFLAYLVTRNVEKMSSIWTMLRIMLCVLPVVGLVGASNLSTAIIILGIAAVLIFCGKSQICTVYLDGSAGMWLYGCVSGTGELSAWSGSQSGVIRNSMRKGIRRCRDCMRSAPVDYLAEDWVRVFRSLGLCRKRRMI